MPPKRRPASDFDAALREGDPWDVGQVVSDALAAQGVCVVDAGLGGDVLAKAIKNAGEFDEAGRLRRPAELLVEGLLGADGSGRVAQLSGDGFDGRPVGDAGEGFDLVDAAIDSAAACLEPHLGFALGAVCRTRSHSLLHESGAASEPAPPLTEDEAADWTYQFSHATVTCLVALGPDFGTLHLTPFDEEAQESSVELAPGTMVLLRSCAVGARFVCQGRGLVVSSFLLASGHKVDRRLQESDIAPAARKLNDWVVTRLDQLKDDELDDQRPQVPRSWIIAMNRQCFKGQHMAIRGMATRLPVTWNEHEFFAATFCGADYCLEVPAVRWDHSPAYNSDPECWRWNQTFTRHMSYIDGAELFDNKVFSLTPAECRIMDPQQRVVLENGYEALLKGGYKKGTIMNSTGGMYLGFGTQTSDFNYMQKSNDAGAEGSFGATGGSAAICANRFNFCLGMRGPSIAIDAEDAGSGVAVHLGCEGLQRRGRLTVNAFSVVGGVKLNLSPYFWPQRQAMGISSSKGRCMTFDQSCDGMVLGDNVTNIVLNALTEVVDDQTVVKEYDELIGVIAGTATNHNGRSANFFAPNGPAEQEVISMTLRGAQLSGFDVDASECYGYGGFLADAVEVSSVMRILRQADECDTPLGLTSIKTTVGNANWAAAALSFARVVLGNTWCCMTPNLHLNQVNPHIEASEQPMLIASEAVEFRMQSGYTHTMSRGFGGTNASILAFGQPQSNT